MRTCGGVSGWSTAMSVAGSWLAIWAVDFEPSAKVRLIVLTPSTTWSAVKTAPLSLTTTPVPIRFSSSGGAADDAAAGAASDVAAPDPLLVSIRTTDGRITPNTSSDRGGPGVWDASALAIATVTSRVVR